LYLAHFMYKLYTPISNENFIYTYKATILTQCFIAYASID